MARYSNAQFSRNPPVSVESTSAAQHPHQLQHQHCAAMLQRRITTVPPSSLGCSALFRGRLHAQACAKGPAVTQQSPASLETSAPPGTHCEAFACSVLLALLGVLIRQTLTGALFPLQVPFGARLPILQPNSPPMLSPMDNGISSDGTGAHTHFALDGLRPISPARRLHSPGFTGVTVRCIGTLSVYMSMHMYVSVHMSVQYLFTCMCACQHTCLYRHACTFVSNIGGVKSDAHTYAHARACMTACLCTCLYAYLCAHLCTYPFTCLSTRLHTCLYTGRPAISSPLPSFVVDDVSMLHSTNVSDGGVH